jgi:hypothetical protein
MASISRLKKGQVVYSIESQKMGNTNIAIKVCYDVRIVEIDLDGRFVMGSWNGNPPRKYREDSVKKWRVSEPAVKGTVLGRKTY